MRSKGETRLLILVVAVSLALTSLTVWAVARQGRALHEREMADLRNVAATAAAQREGALRGELLRACDAAGHLWLAGGVDKLDVWAADQRAWLLTLIAAPNASWLALPRTPLEQPLPGPRDPNDEGPPSARYDLTATLDYFKRMAMSPDPPTRAGALLHSATYEQQLGHPLAAARILADAANLLRATPGLARFAFRAELHRIDSLLAAGDNDRARQALDDFLTGMINDHPGRLGPREIEHLQQQAGELGLGHDDPLSVMLVQVSRRAHRRQTIADAAITLLSEQPAPADSLSELDQPADRLLYLNGQTADGEAFIVAVRTIAEGTRMALVAPTNDLLERYWHRPAGDLPWQVELHRHESPPALLRLGPAFAFAEIAPTPATAAQIDFTTRWRLFTLLATAAGTAGAWILVIWMLSRVVARQRELAHLQSRFVADVSHELKTPLALIRLLSETLAEGRVRNPDRIQSYHETITREAERLSALLDNILDLGRIESGRKEYTLADCDMSAVAHQAWALYEPQFASDGFEAHLELAPNLPTIRADAAAMQQVLVNLLQNAYRYGGTGKYVRLAVTRTGHALIIIVEDHGIGMNRHQLDRLGESFFRAEDTRVRQTRGTGLGLAIVNHIITAHRGKLEVQSRPGQGSTFTVWLPCTPTEQT